MGITRFTHQLAGRWGRFYYVFSAIVRPLGIILIVIGWMAVNSIKPAFSLTDMNFEYWLMYLGWNTASGPEIMFWINIMSILGMLLSLAFGVWAIFVLGMRKSCMYRDLKDSLITRGPYGIVRHPQFLSAIGITFFSSVLFPAAQWGTGTIQTWIPAEASANWVMFTVALWILAIIEDRELALHFGEEYQAYASRVPRIFPN
ncbi:MAG: hypothetical protein JW822_05130 [Spirochaetales bacterium]|nr:hypothetical protein [Spirochaetales bacterium]